LNVTLALAANTGAKLGKLLDAGLRSRYTATSLEAAVKFLHRDEVALLGPQTQFFDLRNEAIKLGALRPWNPSYLRRLSQVLTRVNQGS